MKNDLKHLRRSELIDLIYEMKKREIELQTRLDEAEAKLQAREITIEKAGSIADAAVQQVAYSRRHRKLLIAILNR